MFIKRKIKIGDLVKINSNCENVRKVVYSVYCIMQTKNGINYVLKNTYNDQLHQHAFTREEIIKL